MDGRYERLVVDFIRSSHTFSSEEQARTLKALGQSVQRCGDWGLYKAGCRPEIQLTSFSTQPSNIVRVRDSLSSASVIGLRSGNWEMLIALLGPSILVDGQPRATMEFVRDLTLVATRAEKGNPAVESWFRENTVGVKMFAIEEGNPIWVAYLTAKANGGCTLSDATFVTCVHV